MAELWRGGPLVLPHEFTLDGLKLVIPKIPTGQLFGWLGHGAWWELFPGCVEPNSMLSTMLRFRSMTDDFDFEHFHDVATVLFGRLTGLHSLDGTGDGWWPGQRMAATALLDWPSYGAWCAEHGSYPLAGDLFEVMGRVYAWMRATRATPMDKDTYQAREKLDQRVFAPPPYQRAISSEASLPRSVRDAEAAMALAALRDTLPGEVIEGEFSPVSR